MVLLRLGDLADSIREVKSLLEVLELERALEMTGFVQPPRIVELLEQCLGPASLERRHTAAARHAFLIGQAHDRPPVDMRRRVLQERRSAYRTRVGAGITRPQVLSRRLQNLGLSRHGADKTAEERCPDRWHASCSASSLPTPTSKGVPT